MVKTTKTGFVAHTSNGVFSPCGGTNRIGLVPSWYVNSPFSGMQWLVGGVKHVFVCFCFVFCSRCRMMIEIHKHNFVWVEPLIGYHLFKVKPFFHSYNSFTHCIRVIYVPSTTDCIPLKCHNMPDVSVKSSLIYRKVCQISNLSSLQIPHVYLISLRHTIKMSYLSSKCYFTIKSIESPLLLCHQNDTPLSRTSSDCGLPAAGDFAAPGAWRRPRGWDAMRAIWGKLEQRKALMVTVDLRTRFPWRCKGLFFFLGKRVWWIATHLCVIRKMEIEWNTFNHVYMKI